MSRNSAPPPPTSLPEKPSFHHASKYQSRRFGLSWIGLIVGVILGIAGGLLIAWELYPQDLSWLIYPESEIGIQPDQLRDVDRAHYVVAIMLGYQHDGDLNKVIEHLAQLNWDGDPIQEVADIACNLARTGYIDSTAGLRGVRAMQLFYSLQGKTSCADSILPEIENPLVIEVTVPTETPTLPPPPTKTPSSNETPTPSGIVIVPTSPPQRSYDGAIFDTFCNVELSGIIEVYVQAAGSRDGIAGEALLVRWDGGEDRFVTGLKPERGTGYADFQMTAGRSYIISMPGHSDPIGSPIVAERCITDGGDEAITSYRVSFIRR